MKRGGDPTCGATRFKRRTACPSRNPVRNNRGSGTGGFRGGLGGAVHVLERDTGLGGDGTAGFVFGRSLDDPVSEASEFHLHLSERSTHLDDFAVELASVGLGAADAEGAGLGEEELGEEIGVGGFAQQREEDARTLFLHLDRGVKGVEGAQPQ